MVEPTPDIAWNAGAYLTYGTERTQPFIDLLAHTRAEAPQRIVDLGCGPGNGMPILRSIWPQADILGIDSSAEMLQRARSATAEDTKIRYSHADIRTFELDHQPDLIVSNAALQWIPEHRALLPRIQGHLAPGGTLAIQLPGNFTAASHRLLNELAAQHPYRDHVDPAAMLQPTDELSDYMHDVAAGHTQDESWDVQGWETTYHHVLTGEDPVFHWVASTAARPVLQGLPEQLADQFTTEYKAALREAYPPTRLGTIFPFRRMFFTARRRS